jgi:hypothetical protein
VDTLREQLRQKDKLSLPLSDKIRAIDMFITEPTIAEALSKIGFQVNSTTQYGSESNEGAEQPFLTQLNDTSSPLAQ